MGTIRYFILGVFFSLLLVACNRSFQSNQGLIEESHEVYKEHIEKESCDDTLSLILDNVCKEFNELYCCYQIAIPEYYSVRDSISTIIDGVKHCFIVLEPIDLVDVEYDCKGDKKRKLLHVLIKNGVAQILNEYDNLISNNGGVSSPFNSISLGSQMLEIKHSFGNRYNWDYTMILNIEKAGLRLSKIRVECANPEKANVIEYKYGQKEIESINIDDTLKGNCGCDRYW